MMTIYNISASTADDFDPKIDAICSVFMLIMYYKSQNSRECETMCKISTPRQLNLLAQITGANMCQHPNLVPQSSFRPR